MIDLLFRIIYRCAYPVMRLIWWVFDPPRQGTLVGVWHRGRILIIKNSYVRYYCVPGGYAKRGETPAQAAARELAEEVRLRIEPCQLKPRPDLTPDAEWAHKNGKLAMFELEVDQEPRAVVDNREVVSAELLTPEQALQLRLFPQVRSLIESHIGD